MVDSCPRIQLGLPILHAKLREPGTGQIVSKDVHREEIKFEYWSTSSPRAVMEAWLDGLQEASMDLPCFEENPRGVPRTEVVYTVAEPSERLWGTEQLVHLTVQSFPQRRRPFCLAASAMERDAPEEAEELLVETIVADPSFALAHYNLGVVRYQLRQLDRAEVSLRNALELGLRAERQARGHAMIGLIHLHRGAVDAALEEYGHALNLEPDLNVEKAAGMIEEKLPRNINASAAHFCAGSAGSGLLSVLPMICAASCHARSASWRSRSAA